MFEEMIKDGMAQRPGPGYPGIEGGVDGAADGLKGVFVLGAGTDVGKSVCVGALLRALRRRGIRAQAVKAIQTGVTPDGPRDAWDESVYVRAVEGMPDIVDLAAGCTLRSFAFPGSPQLAAALEGRALTVETTVADVRRHWRRLVEDGGDPDLLVLEGAGGIGSPIDATRCMADLAAQLDLPVLLVAGAGLGGLGHILTRLDALAARGLSPAGVALVTPPSPVGAGPKPETAGGADRQLRVIVEDTSRFLRERFATEKLDIPVVTLPRVAVLDEKGWNRLAEAVAPLAERFGGLRKPVAAWAKSGSGPSSPPSVDIVERDRKHIWHPYAKCEAGPLWAVERSWGNRLVLADGRELVDGMSSWWAAIHGYNHPRLVRALTLQAGRMPHVMFGGLTHRPAVELAERLLAKMPSGLERVFFADSGSVAVEVAMKMALQYQHGKGHLERTRFLTVRGGYHGDTLGAMSVCDPVNGMHSLFAGYLPEHVFLDRPVCPFDGIYARQGLPQAEDVFSRLGGTFAGFIIEPVVQGAGGMWFYHPGFLQDMVRLCRRHGMVVIFDEIATGFGRTGRYFAAEWAGVRPDILCCGKALTGGMLTLAATACTDTIAKGICRKGDAFMHGPTFMANPLACAVACASLDELDACGWSDKVATLEATMRRGLAPCRKAPGVKDVRVLGGIGVVETVDPVDTDALQARFVDRGVWLRPFGNLVYLMPPYVSPVEDVERLCSVMAEALGEGLHLRETKDAH